MSPEDMQRFQFLDAWFPGEKDHSTLLTHDPCSLDYRVRHGDTLAELVRWAEEHAEVCR
jgi:hypothetical protein